MVKKYTFAQFSSGDPRSVSSLISRLSSYPTAGPPADRIYIGHQDGWRIYHRLFAARAGHSLS